MKIFKKISEMSVSSAIITAGIIIGLSIFLTTYFFFGGYNNRTKLFLTTPPTQQRNFPANFNPQQQAQQIQLQQLQAQQQAQQAALIAPSQVTATSSVKAPVAPKVIKK